MKKTTRNFFIVLLTLSVSFGSCKKDTGINNISIINGQSKDVPNFYFPWYAATGMPVAPNVPAANIPPMPWQSQSGTPIDANIVTDYKNTDGWDLVYNTFNKSTQPYLSTLPVGGLYFALYNKYRGLLRFYLFMPSGLVNNNVNIQHGLNVYSQNNSTTSMLNFDGTDLVDPSIKTPYITKANNVGVAVAGGWYAMQYEIAYDPNFASTTYPNLGLQWNSRTVSISDIKLNGTEEGTLNGTLTQQSSGIGSTIINGVAAAAEIFGLATNPGNTSPTALQNAAQGGLAGNLTGFFSGIFGGNSSNTQEVDLKMNSTINLTGTSSGSQLLTANSLVAPGQTVGNTIGAPLPLTNYALGVFNISNRPTINSRSTTTPPPYTDNTTTSTFYTLNTSSFTIQYNPALLNNASVTILKEEILLIDNAPDYPLYTNAKTEQIGNLWAYSRPTGGLQWQVKDVVTQTFPQYAVRISLQIVPNSNTGYTGKPITIVKTFLANRVGG